MCISVILFCPPIWQSAKTLFGGTPLTKDERRKKEGSRNRRFFFAPPLPSQILPIHSRSHVTVAQLKEYNCSLMQPCLYNIASGFGVKHVGRNSRFNLRIHTLLNCLNLFCHGRRRWHQAQDHHWLCVTPTSNSCTKK